MKRSDLEDGGQYVGPDDQCYEIVDMTPGWRIDHTGAWVQDDSMRSRHMPGRGTVSYRSNLCIRAYIIGEDGTRKCAVVDPRKLSGTWDDFMEVYAQQQQELKQAMDLVRRARRALREGHHRPASTDLYSIRPDGQAVTVPMEDLRYLVDLANSQLVGSGA